MRQKIRIKKGNITFLYRIRPPLTVRVSESLCEIVMKKGKIRSFRFKVRGRKAQVSPSAYTDGDRLLAQLKAIIRKERIVINIIDK